MKYYHKWILAGLTGATLGIIELTGFIETKHSYMILAAFVVIALIDTTISAFRGTDG